VLSCWLLVQFSPVDGVVLPVVLMTYSLLSCCCGVCQYYRFSVGGMTDVAEIKGHRSAAAAAAAIITLLICRFLNFPCCVSVVGLMMFL